MVKPDFIDNVIYKLHSGRPAVIITYRNQPATAEQYRDIASLLKEYLEESEHGSHMIKDIGDFCYWITPSKGRNLDGFEIERYYLGGRRVDIYEAAVIKYISPFGNFKILKEFAKRLA